MMDKQLGSRIRALRQERKMTQQQIADLLGVDRGNVSRYEKGEQLPESARLPRLAEALGVTLAELLAESPFEKLQRAAAVTAPAEPEPPDSPAAPAADPVTQYLIDDLISLINVPADKSTTDTKARIEKVLKAIAFRSGVTFTSESVIRGLARTPVSDERVEQFIPPAPKVGQ